MSSSRFKSLVAVLRRLPSFVWIILFIAGLIAFIGAIIGLFYLLSSVEGAASIIMLLVAWGVIRLGSSADPGTTSSKGSSIITAIAITFFALMGVAIDQPGNPIYNQPLEWFFCPSGSELHRGVIVTNPLPGQTNVSQDFSCVKSGEVRSVTSIGMFKIIAVRFGEYVLVGYGLIALNRLYIRLKKMRSHEQRT